MLFESEPRLAIVIVIMPLDEAKGPVQVFCFRVISLINKCLIVE